LAGCAASSPSSTAARKRTWSRSRCLPGTDFAEGRRTAERVLASPTCSIPEIPQLGRTLKQWRAAFLAYFTTSRSSNGGTEAVNGLIALHRRIARGFTNRDNYRLRVLLIGGGLTHPHVK